MSKVRDAWERRRQRKQLDAQPVGKQPAALVIDESSLVPPGILERVSRQHIARPSQVRVARKGDPKFSLARRRRNKAKRLSQRNTRRRLPHGRRVKPHGHLLHQDRRKGHRAAQRLR